jgi:hypothetical protein
MKTKCTNIENNKNITSDHDTKQDQTGTPPQKKTARVGSDKMGHAFRRS